MRYIKGLFAKEYKRHYTMGDLYGRDYYSDPIKNPIVHRCINLIACTASHVPWRVFRGSKQQRCIKHPLNLLLKKPNPYQGGAEFFKDLIGNKLTYGNAYILACTNGEKSLFGIKLLNPRYVKEIIVHGKLVGYTYKELESNEQSYKLDPLWQQSKVLHIKNYNPSGRSGLSCTDIAKDYIQLYDSIIRWNKGIIHNAAKPAAAMIVDRDSVLTDEQLYNLRSDVQNKYTGPNNAGKTIVLDHGLDWREMSIQRDMDFMAAKNQIAKDIALFFGVPSQMIGITQDNTYRNMQEARDAFWEDTIIPLLDLLCDAMSKWFSYLYQEEIVLDCDLDSISALSERREKLWRSLNENTFMTTEEKRAYVGLAPSNKSE